MGPYQEGTWDKVPAPENAGTYTADQATSVNGGKGSSGSSYKASGPLSSKGGTDYADKQGSNTASPSTQSIGNGNVKALSSSTPGGEAMDSSVSMWGGRGVGGY